MSLRDLFETRASLRSQMNAIHDSPEGEGGELSDAQDKRFAELRGDYEKTEKAIERQAFIDEADRAAEGVEVTGDGQSRERRSLIDRYSLAKAMTESMNGALTGAEAELNADLSRDREARGIMVPTEILLGSVEQRALLTSGTAGNMVQTELAAMSDRRRPTLKIQSMGATVLSGLTGNLDLPRLASSGAASWVAEHTDATRSDPGFLKKSMDPKTVTAEYEMARRLRLQSHEAMEPILRNDLGFLLTQGLDSAAIKGGGANEPTGVMADADVSEVPGAAIGSDLTAEMIAELEIDDVTGTRAFLTHPRVIGDARKLKDNDNLPIPLATTFHQERVEHSTQAPVVTAGPPDTYPLIYGEWASLYLGYWSGVDILVNPYHGDVASKGGALLHAFLDCDVVVRHPEAFRWAEIS
ncbi:MAG: phage major capsid protein [Pseudomonadota bacterium]